MPYIPEERRDDLIDGNKQEVISTAGELNYGFTMLLQEYVKTKGLSYQTINDIIGALEGAKMEFYRRVAVPYEDIKRDLNGDVYLDDYYI